MTLNAYFINRFRPEKCQLQRSKLCDVVECLGHFDRIVPSLADSLACMLTKQHDIRSGKYLLKTISETLNFKMSLDGSALKNLCLWCEFQSCLLFIISLLLKNVLTVLVVGYFSGAVGQQLALSDIWCLDAYAEFLFCFLEIAMVILVTWSPLCFGLLV